MGQEEANYHSTLQCSSFSFIKWQAKYTGAKLKMLSIHQLYLLLHACSPCSCAGRFKDRYFIAIHKVRACSNIHWSLFIHFGGSWIRLLNCGWAFVLFQDNFSTWILWSWSIDHPSTDIKNPSAFVLGFSFWRVTGLYKEHASYALVTQTTLNCSNFCLYRWWSANWVNYNRAFSPQ